MSQDTEIDDLDKKIIRMLQEDSRKPFVEIAKELGVSDPTVHARVKKLQETGVIEKFTTVLAPTRVEKAVAAFIEINVKPNTIEEVVKSLESMDEVLEIHETHGEYDIIAKVRVKTNEDLRNIVVGKIRSSPNITDTKVITVLKTRKEAQLKLPGEK
ncbi:Lrp/AsnC family transcriptional regulator [Candidatus Hecatella orcuttiae]|jgi:Lrp/AsnC family transcriptional regulator for asnA, asnC and gidA|uniref:Lrp/AsnC family transcriptional regulator n=1 Tax=Candidatus Hecatella orcuttiae TaxID=1935119 RepID=UPI0028681BDE|nr:Lrp/AsnC family transcriptional regulator [Candidatus Hecatella orcuttiae]